MISINFKSIITVVWTYRAPFKRNLEIPQNFIALLQDFSTREIVPL